MTTTSTYSTYEVRLRAVRAVQSGHAVTQVAKVFGVARRTLNYWLERERDDPENGLRRRSDPGSARPRKAPQVDSRFLIHLTASDATDHGFDSNLWTTRRVEQVLARSPKTRLSRSVVRERLREARLTWQKPRRQYIDEDGDEAKRREWLAEDWPLIKETAAKHRAILYFEDEAHIALSPVVGKTWAPRGKTPAVKVTSKRGGFSAMSAISEGGSLVWRLFDHRIRSAEVIDFLKELLRHHPRRHLVVVMDNASPHCSKATVNFIESQKRLHVFWLPPRSPELNPDEKVWNHVKNQELKSHHARDKKELLSLAKRKMARLSRDTSKVRGIYLWGYEQRLSC
jgi:transposase